MGCGGYTARTALKNRDGAGPTGWDEMAGLDCETYLGWERHFWVAEDERTRRREEGFGHRKSPLFGQNKRKASSIPIECRLCENRPYSFHGFVTRCGDVARRLVVGETECGFDIAYMTTFPKGVRTSFIAIAYTPPQIPIPPSILPSSILQLRFGPPIQLGPGTPI